jgi:hypothetical protein
LDRKWWKSKNLPPFFTFIMLVEIVEDVRESSLIIKFLSVVG